MLIVLSLSVFENDEQRGNSLFISSGYFLKGSVIIFEE